jgi:hypothetical protein
MVSLLTIAISRFHRSCDQPALDLVRSWWMGKRLSRTQPLSFPVLPHGPRRASIVGHGRKSRAMALFTFHCRPASNLGE